MREKGEVATPRLQQTRRRQRNERARFCATVRSRRFARNGSDCLFSRSCHTPHTTHTHVSSINTIINISSRSQQEAGSDRIDSCGVEVCVCRHPSERKRERKRARERERSRLQESRRRLGLERERAPIGKHPRESVSERQERQIGLFWAIWATYVAEPVQMCRCRAIGSKGFSLL